MDVRTLLGCLRVVEGGHFSPTLNYFAWTLGVGAAVVAIAIPCVCFIASAHRASHPRPPLRPQSRERTGGLSTVCNITLNITQQIRTSGITVVGFKLEALRLEVLPVSQTSVRGSDVLLLSEFLVP
jgi:hypothetical protein